MWGTERYNLVEVSALYRYSDISDDESDEEPYERRNSTSQKIQAAAESHLPILPENKFPNHKVKWQISFKDNKVEVAASVDEFATRPGRNPRAFLDSAAESIFVDCTHDPASSLSQKHARIIEALPLNPRLPWNHDGASVRIVQCADNEPMRFFCLASGVPGVIRMDACLECCVAHSQLLQHDGYILC